MAIPSGLGQTTAIAEETTYGTAPSLTGARGYYVNSNSLAWEKNVVQGEGMRGSSLVAHSTRRVMTSQQSSGDIEMDFATKGMGLWLKHAMGNSGIVQIGATPAFTQQFTLSTTLGKSLTIQRGLPLTDASLQPWTFTGCKIAGFTIGADNQDICKLNVTIDGQDGSTGVGYATPSYTLADAASVLSFAGSGLYATGNPGTLLTDVVQFGFEVNHSLKTDRYLTGASGLKAEPLNNGLTQAVVTVDAEYADNVSWVARNFSDETFYIRQWYEGEIITGSTRFSLEILTPAVKIDTGMPTGDDVDVLTQSLSMPVLYNGTDNPISISYVSTDTSI